MLGSKERLTVLGRIGAEEGKSSWWKRSNWQKKKKERKGNVRISLYLPVTVSAIICLFCPFIYFQQFLLFLSGNVKRVLEIQIQKSRINVVEQNNSPPHSTITGSSWEAYTQRTHASPLGNRNNKITLSLAST